MKPKHKLSNPAAIATVLNSDTGKTLIFNAQENQKKALQVGKTLLIGGSIAIAAWWGLGKYKLWEKQQFIEKYAHLPDVQASMVMRKAMFKSEGISVFPFGTIQIPDGTDENALNSLALKVTSLENVIKAYKVLFDSNLMTDVLSELNNKELEKFFNNLGAKSLYEQQFNSNGSTKPQAPFKIGQTMKVLNPKGTTIFKAKQNDSGNYYNSNQQRDFKKFDETVGTVEKVYRGVNTGSYYYVMDMHYSIDTIYGYGWVAHTEIIEKI